MNNEQAAAAGEESFELPRLSRYFFELSPQPMIALEGATHVVRYVNAAFLQLAGKEGRELIGRPFAEAVPEGASNGCRSLLDRVYRTGKPETLVEQAHGPMPPVCWSYSVWAVLGPDELPTGLTIEVTDSTDISVFRGQVTAINESLLLSSLRQHELTETAERLNALLQAAIRAKDHFLAVLSHELRNPLAPLRNGLQLLELLEGQPDGARDVRDMMERQLNQMVLLVNDLLDISRLTTGKLVLRKEHVELAEIVRNAVESTRPQIEHLGHELTVTLPDAPIWLDADPLRLGQVFLNLLNNAAKYSDRGGRIGLTAVVEEEGESATSVAIRIKDTGIGIPANHLPQVFEMFSQVDTDWKRTQGGLGIGLSLVRGFVEMHGGSVEARSEGLGRGSEFVVRLPLASDRRRAVDRDSADPAAVATYSSPLAAKRRILVVEDNRDSAGSLAMMLKLQGHETAIARDGRQAVELAETFRPEVILLDIGLPELTGHEVARHIRAQSWGRDMTLVALTGWSQDEDRRRSQEAGFNHHLVKPIDSATLQTLLAESVAQTSVRIRES
jgi:signal transduction histidine kinase/ActR/RegA family two-component response regulator